MHYLLSYERTSRVILVLYGFQTKTSLTQYKQIRKNFRYMLLHNINTQTHNVNKFIRENIETKIKYLYSTDDLLTFL